MADIFEVGRMLAERAFASSFRWQLSVSAVRLFVRRLSALRFGAVENGGRRMHDLLLAHGTGHVSRYSDGRKSSPYQYWINVAAMVYLISMSDLAG